MKLLCSVAFALLLAAPAVAQPAATPPATAQDAVRLEDFVQPAIQKHNFMGTVLVARGDEILLNKGYGQANVEWNIPNTPATKFRLGSLTKQFTAASILLLEERGKLAIEDPLSQHIADVPAAWSAITLHHLLTHTSGIPNVTALPEFATYQPFATTVEKTIALVRDKPLDFAPGDRMSYSNSGYLVLSHLVERISGQSYETFLKANILDPLGMKDSGLDSNATIIPRRAAGYTNSATGLVNAGFVHMSVPHGAGAMYSTTEDLLRWERGLFGGKVLSEASLRKMTTPFKNNYALGVSVVTLNGKTRITHGGGIQGFNTALSYDPDARIVVVVLANVNGPAADNLALALMFAARGEAVSVIKDDAFDLTPRK
jgi:CubicO group peptidase (beta-lactamase class C family)